MALSSYGIRIEIYTFYFCVMWVGKWMNNADIYIYIYIYVCVCVCVCVFYYRMSLFVIFSIHLLVYISYIRTFLWTPCSQISSVYAFLLLAILLRIQQTLVRIPSQRPGNPDLRFIVFLLSPYRKTYSKIVHDLFIYNFIFFWIHYSKPSCHLIMCQLTAGTEMCH
jgi:hypothetical protein